MVQGLKSKQENIKAPLRRCARCAGAIPELQSSLVSDMPKKNGKLPRWKRSEMNIWISMTFLCRHFSQFQYVPCFCLFELLGFPTRPWWASRTGRYPPRPWGQAEYQELSTVTITLEYHKYVDQILNMNTLPPPSSPSSRRTTSHHILSSFTRSSIIHQKPIAASWFTIKFIINCPIIHDTSLSVASSFNGLTKLDQPGCLESTRRPLSATSWDSMSS